MSESVNGQICTKRIKGADENHIGRVQVLVFFPFTQQFHVNHGLIKTAAFGQAIVGCIGALHLNVGDVKNFVLLD